MNRDQVADLLKVMSTYDAREITDVAVDAWHWQARNADWDYPTAAAAVQTFYGWVGEEAITWRDTKQPRPILPVDITAFHELKWLVS